MGRNSQRGGKLKTCATPLKIGAGMARIARCGIRDAGLGACGRPLKDQLIEESRTSWPIHRARFFTHFSTNWGGVSGEMGIGFSDRLAGIEANFRWVVGEDSLRNR